MAKLLFIAFGPSELPVAKGLATALAAPFDILLLSGAATDAGADTLFGTGWTEVPPADGLAEAIAPLCGGYSHIAAASSMQSKDVLARLAGVLDAPMVTDVVAALSPATFRRPVAAGTVLATVEVTGEPVVMTVRPAGFPAGESAPNGRTESVALSVTSRTVRTSQAAKAAGRPDLTQARVVVSGGRPLKDAETFERVLGGLADKLGGAVGATRAAVDSGIAPNELQVGQTGKIVAPELYIAAGVSGSTQHMAGIKDSKVIVAINKDPDAPIFESADYGLVADLFDALPELQSKL